MDSGWSLRPDIRAGRDHIDRAGRADAPAGSLRHRNAIGDHPGNDRAGDPGVSRLGVNRPASDGARRRRFHRQLASKALVLPGLFEQQVGEAEVGLHPLFLALEAINDFGKALGIRPEHWAAAIDGPAVAVDPHHFDIRRALGDPFLKDLRALVDHRIERALDDLFIADLAALDAFLLGEILDDLLDHWRRRRPPLLVVIVEARALFLAPSIDRAQSVADILDPFRVAMPADVDAGEVGHLEWPHGHSEFYVDAIDLLGCRTFEEQLRRLDLPRHQHSIADEAVAHASDHRHLLDAL